MLDDDRAVMTVRMRAAELTRLDDRARDAGVTRSEYVRRILMGDSIADRVWIAHYTDMSGVVPFTSEVAALRHAVDHHMEVTPVIIGQDLIIAMNPRANPQR